MGKILQHNHIIVDAIVLNPPTDVEFMNKWMEDLVHSIDMTIMMGPITGYSDMPGNRGLTSAVVLTQSHCTAHFWDEVSPGIAKIDLYTCGSLDKNKLFQALSIFNPLSMKYKVLDRDTDLIELEEGFWNG